MWRNVAAMVVYQGIGFIAVACVFIVFDALYFQGGGITAWNSIMYNINPNNLAQHGLHPRYLHILVNASLLFV